MMRNSIELVYVSRPWVMSLVASLHWTSVYIVQIKVLVQFYVSYVSDFAWSFRTNDQCTMHTIIMTVQHKMTPHLTLSLLSQIWLKTKKQVYSSVLKFNASIFFFKKRKRKTHTDIEHRRNTNTRGLVYAGFMTKRGPAVKSGGWMEGRKLEESKSGKAVRALLAFISSLFFSECERVDSSYGPFYICREGRRLYSVSEAEQWWWNARAFNYWCVSVTVHQPSWKTERYKNYLELLVVSFRFCACWCKNQHYRVLTMFFLSGF